MLLSREEYLTLLKNRLGSLSARGQKSTRKILTQNGSQANAKRGNPEIDNHLAKTLLSKHKGFFRPSVFEIFGTITSALLKPVPLLLICSLFIGIQRSRTTFIGTEEEVLEAELSRALDDNTEESLLEKFTPFSYEDRPSTSEDEALISYITGIITVYLPQATDSGGIAKDIVSAARRAEVDPLYVASIVSVESRFSKTARSHVGALGLMQLMPRTALEVAHGIAGKQAKPRLTDRKTNLRLGIRYLKSLHRKYKGDQRHVLAAYNWGMTKVDRYRKGEIKLPRSVEKYASTIIARNKAWRKHFKTATENVALYLEDKA